MTPQSRQAACERARVWAALLPDNELSSFERRLLEAHCHRCADCRHALESIGGVTELIRGAPLAAMERRVRVLRARPAYWRSIPGVLATGAAAAFALAVAFWVGPQHAPGVKSPTLTAPVIEFTPESSSADSDAIWKLKRARGGGRIRMPDTRHTGPVL